MKESNCKNYDELPLFLNAETVAKVLGVSPSSGYELMREPDFPVLKIVSRLVVPNDGSAKRRGYQDSFRYAGPLLCGVHAGCLYQRDERNAEGCRKENRRLHSGGHVKIWLWEPVPKGEPARLSCKSISLKNSWKAAKAVFFCVEYVYEYV